MKGNGPDLWRRVAVACGVVPLVSAVLFMLGFYVCERETFSSLEGWLEPGVVLIVAGLVLFVVGVGALCVSCVRGRRGSVADGELARRAVMPLLLLLLNFPVAFACVVLALDSISQVRLRLVNESPTVVEDLEIRWPGGVERLGDLAPGQSLRISLHPTGDGVVEFTARQDGEEREGELVGYVTSGMGLTSDVVLLGDGQVRVEDR